MAEGAEDEDKTEEPSQRRLDQARERGDVAKSLEVNNLFLLFGATLAIAMFANSASSDLTSALKVFLGQAHAIGTDPNSLRITGVKVGLAFLGSVGLPMLILMVCGILGNIAQHGLLYTTEQLTPKFSKISPMAGFKRLFSKQSLMNFAKGIVKLILVGIAVTAAVWPERAKIGMTAALDVARLGPFMLDLSLTVAKTAVIVVAIMAAFDYLYQRQAWRKKLMMSREEMKEEYKQTEGSPEIKARIRRIRHEKARKRMMQQVPQASVVVTNPTHYAVALRYEKGMDAPICVAKGVDLIALKIREIAGKHDIPIVENPPLARALYAQVEIDDSIPEEHYRAVAEVIGYVMRLKKKSSLFG